MPTPLVRVTLGAATDWFPELRKGDTVEVDAIRAAQIVAQIPKSEPATDEDAEVLDAFLASAEAEAELADPPKEWPKKKEKR